MQQLSVSHEIIIRGMLLRLVCVDCLQRFGSSMKVWCEVVVFCGAEW